MSTINWFQELSEKKNLWNKLHNLMTARPGNWVLFGDYNAVRRPDERMNSVFCPNTAKHFNKFITGAGLLDLNMGGRRFTYFNDVGCKHSKLDRFLVCANFIPLSPTPLSQLCLGNTPTTPLSF